MVSGKPWNQEDRSKSRSSDRAGCQLQIVRASRIAPGAECLTTSRRRALPRHPVLQGHDIGRAAARRDLQRRLDEPGIDRRERQLFRIHDPRRAGLYPTWLRLTRLQPACVRPSWRLLRRSHSARGGDRQHDRRGGEGFHGRFHWLIDDVLSARLRVACDKIKPPWTKRLAARLASRANDEENKTNGDPKHKEHPVLPINAKNAKVLDQKVQRPASPISPG